MKKFITQVVFVFFLTFTFVQVLQARDWKEYSKEKSKKIGKKFGKSLKKRKNSVSRLFISKTIKSDEYVVFYPALASLGPRGQFWTVEIHGLIYEHTTFSKSVPFVSKLIGFKKLKPVKQYRNLYKERLGWFFIDNERGKRLQIALKGKRYTLKPSGSNGHFKGHIKIPASTVKTWSLDKFQRISFKAITNVHDDRVFSGEIYFTQQNGVSVISDIDDTIKLSEVHDKKKLIKNTFFRPYLEIPGMAQTYMKWYRQHKVQLHYVTSSPWQLYVPLRKFMENAKFPPGSFHMKFFRIKDRSFFNVFSKSLNYKVQSISRIIQQYPLRTFILVGDSGEKDLQVYTKIAEKYPGRINVIYIRDTGHRHKNYKKNSLYNAPDEVNGTPVIVFDTDTDPASLEFYGPRIQQPGGYNSGHQDVRHHSKNYIGVRKI